MSEKRIDFVQNHDHIRRGLMFEPRGHDMMSGSFIYPSNDEEVDLHIIHQTSGCLLHVWTRYYRHSNFRFRARYNCLKMRVACELKFQQE